MLATILREVDAPRMLVVETYSPNGPLIHWWGDIDEEEIEAQLDEGQTVDWSSVVQTPAGGWIAPLTRD